MPFCDHNTNLSPFDHCTSISSFTNVQSRNPPAFVQICHAVWHICTKAVGLRDCMWHICTKTIGLHDCMWHICTKAVGLRDCTVTLRLLVLHKQDTDTHHTVTVQLCHPTSTSYGTCSNLLSCVQCIRPLYRHVVTTIRLLCKRATTCTSIPPYGHCTNMPLYGTVRLTTSLIYNN